MEKKTESVEQNVNEFSFTLHGKVKFVRYQSAFPDK